MQQIEQQLRAFINETFLFGAGADKLGRDESFLEKGIIDSTGVLELVNFIEQKYAIKLADEELIPENLDSVGRLTSFVTEKLASVQKGAAVCN